MDMCRKLILPFATYDGIENCFANLEIKLKNADTNKPVFSVSGYIFGGHVSGQCIDEIAEMYPNNKLVQRIHELWKTYHLNDMHAGCIHQREFEKEPYENHKDDYCKICDYIYGTNWNYEPIPENILKEIKAIISAQ